ncbi:hypothetical protein PM082_008674 [Marasmius tenuissimus]|nr:hypothetical protein PM082_008674 [Marasmius tenuissimus]
MSIVAQKKALRKSVSTVLRALSAQNIDEQSKLVTASVLALPIFQNSQRISCYLSMPSGEVDTSSIVSEILKSGKQLFVPRIDKTTAGKMDFVRVYNAADLSSSPAGLWGIKEPSHEYSGHPRANALDESLDMILMPGRTKLSSRIGPVLKSRRKVLPSTDLCQDLAMEKDTMTDISRHT